MLTTKQRLEHTMHTAESAIFRGEDATGWLWLYELSSRKLKELSTQKLPAFSATGNQVLNTVIDTYSIPPKEGVDHA